MSLLQPDSISECMNHFQNNSYWYERRGVENQLPLMLVNKGSVLAQSLLSTELVYQRRGKWLFPISLLLWRSKGSGLQVLKFPIHCCLHFSCSLELPGCKENCICWLSGSSRAYRKVMLLTAHAWSSPVVQKKRMHGTLQFCVDYRDLNSVTKPDVFPLPWIVIWNYFTALIRSCSCTVIVVHAYSVYHSSSLIFQ